jgi:hypothetical protein
MTKVGNSESIEVIMTDVIASVDALVDRGVLAYKNREYKESITELQKVLDVEPRHWRAKLYLAMSYYHGGEVFAAYRHFSYLRDNCTDSEIRLKAESAMNALNDQLTPKAPATNGRMPEMTCTMKKPTTMVPLSFDPDTPFSESEAETLEWVDTRTERI